MRAADAARGIRAGMAVRGADGGALGTVEEVGADGFVADGRRIGFDAVAAVEGGAVRLFGSDAAYAEAGATDEARAQRERSQGLPNTDGALFVNERPVRDSLEERMPDDRPR